MSQQLATVNPAPSGVIAAMAARFDMDPRAFEATLRATVVPQQCTREQFAAFLLVAKEYELNPLLKEIYAFPAKGGIQPIVSIDGWMNLMNSHPQFDGIEFEDELTDDGLLMAITAKVYRKDRSHPTAVTEYMVECVRPTDPWKQYPRRMLRHKAAIQAARYAFGFSGIMEPDEYERLEATQAPPLKRAVAPAIRHIEATPIEDEAIDAGLAPEHEPFVTTEPKKAPPVSAPQTTAEEEETPRSPDEVLAELENVVSGIMSEDDLNAVWANYQNDPALAFPGDKARAAAIISRQREIATS